MSINNHIEESNSLFHFIDDKYVCKNCLSCDGLKLWFKETCADKLLITCDYCICDSRCVVVKDLQKHILKYFELTDLQHFCPRDEGEYLLRGISSEDWLDQNVSGAVADKLYEDLYDIATDQVYERYDW